MTSEGGRHPDAGAKTVTDDSPLKVAVIKAIEALMKRIYNSTRLEIPRKVASNITWLYRGRNWTKETLET